MNGIFTPHLFAIMLIISIVPMNLLGQDRASSDKDFVDLLEMQLADSKKDNARISDELRNLKAGSKSKSGYKKDIEQLKKENNLLKSEIITLDKDIGDAAKVKAETLAEVKAEALVEVNALRKEVEELKISKVSVEKGDTNEEMKALCTNLEDENAILKKEVDGQKRLIFKIECEFDQVNADLKRFSEAKSKDRVSEKDLNLELVQLKKELATAEANLLVAKSGAINEDQATEMLSEMNKMKAIEEQRKANLDDLFTQLAEVKAKLKDKADEIVSLESKASDSSGILGLKDSEIVTLKKEMQEMQTVINSHSASQSALKQDIEKGKGKVSLTEVALEREIAIRQNVENKLNSIKLTDVQRKKAMDDVLTNLATSENISSERASQIKVLETGLAELRLKSESQIDVLSKKNIVLDNEVISMEQELKVALDSRDALNSKITKVSNSAQHDSARVVELDAELAKIRATDSQRKKSMDKLLLEISKLEETQAANQNLGNSNQKDMDKLTIELTEAQSMLSESREVIKHLKSAKIAGVSGDNSELASELASLQQSNERLQQKIQELENRTAVVIPAGERSSNVEGVDELAALEKAQWLKDKSDLDSEIAYLQKTGEAQGVTLSKLKSDLAEAEQMKGRLSGEVNKLKNRKIDVRSSDLFQEMESVNIKLREKIVQIESERQRLSKSEKNLLKRDGRFDDEIDHEKNLRQKAESDIADARAREVEYQELIERLMAQVPQLEAQITELTDKYAETRSRLSDREEDLLAMKAELEKREHRLIKAERVAEVLESAREDVLHASDKEKLDMHYNMAAVYAREGKYDAAEQEYLHALRLNPTDADVHYNLGILYEDELKSSTKAIVHYRRYLKLNPHGPDADKVRNWLMKLEMKKKQ